MRRKLFSLAKLSLVLMLIAVAAFSLLGCNKDSGEVGTEITITVSVTNKVGETRVDEIKTTATNLGDALVESGIVKDNKDDYGLYILEVYGEVADYNVDRSYWALSKDGEYLMTGASDTKITDGDKFELVYTIE